MKKPLVAAFACCAVVALAASGETNLVSEAARRAHVSAYADIETAYWARGESRKRDFLRRVPSPLEVRNWHPYTASH